MHLLFANNNSSCCVLVSIGEVLLHHIEEFQQRLGRINSDGGSSRAEDQDHHHRHISGKVEERCQEESYYGVPFPWIPDPIHRLLQTLSS